MKAFDKEIQALSGKIKHHLGHNYSNDTNRARNSAELVHEYRKASQFPASEVTCSVWDKMNGLARQALIV